MSGEDTTDLESTHIERFQENERVTTYIATQLKPWYRLEALLSERDKFLKHCRNCDIFPHVLQKDLEEIFHKHATPEEKEVRSLASNEVKHIDELLLAYGRTMWAQLSLSPCLTHVTTIDAMPQILREGLKPSALVGYGNYDQYDQKYPELGLREVVHCGWGGIDRFSIQMPEAVVVLLIDPKVIQPSDKVTNKDWSIWGPIAMGKRGGSELAARNTVEDYMRSLKTAADYKMNPYSQVSCGLYHFLTEGLNVGPGFLSIPTILLPSVPPEAIKGAIVGEMITQHSPDTFDSLSRDISAFSWDELAIVDIAAISNRKVFEFARLSQRARYAEARIDGRNDQFEKMFGDKIGSVISDYLKAYERDEVLRNLDYKILENVRSRQPRRI